MPLIHSSSKKAREENIKRELEAHPNMNPKQAVAIGYSVQRHAKADDQDERRIEREAHERFKYGK
jgi:hypothetical protein